MIRFEELGESAKVPPAPTKIQMIRKGKGKDETGDVKVVEKDGLLELTASTTNQPNNVQGAGPQDQSGPNDAPAVYVLPRRAKLGRNTTREADTLELEFRYRDLPLDPRCVRSCAVNFYLGTVSANDFARGIDGSARSQGDSGAGEELEPLHVIPDEWIDAQGRPRSNLRFQGWVDEWTISWSDDEPTVRLNCTDNTRLLIDNTHPPQLQVDPKIPIDKAIARYLANFPQFVGLSVRFLPTSATPPTLAEVLDKATHKVPAKAGGDSKTSVWDYLTDVTGRLGLLIRVRGTTVVVQKPRNFVNGRRRIDDPYLPRRLPTGRVLDFRTLVYGRNVVETELSRNYTKHANQNIEVRSYNGRRKKTLVVRFPEKGNEKGKGRVVDVKHGDRTEEKWEVIRISAVTDEKQLKFVAQAVYESRNRQELNVKLTTKNLASYGGGNEDPDLLDVETGDAIVVETQREEEEFNTINVVENRLSEPNQAEQFLRLLGFPAEFAAQYGHVFSNLDVPKLFRVRRAGFDWDDEKGTGVELECVNFIVVRADKFIQEEEKQDELGFTVADEDTQEPDEPIDVQVEE